MKSISLTKLSVNIHLNLNHPFCSVFDVRKIYISIFEFISGNFFILQIAFLILKSSLTK